MDDFNKNDDLWNLLGRAKPAQASPYFTRKVLRAVQEESTRPAFSFSVLLRWLLPTSALAALALGWFTYYDAHERAMAEFNEQFEIIADLPALVAYEDTSLWTEG